MQKLTAWPGRIGFGTEKLAESLVRMIVERKRDVAIENRVRTVI